MDVSAVPHLQQVIETQKPLVIRDTRRDEQWLRRTESDYIRSWLGAPLVVKGRAIGLLNLDKEKVGFYNKRAQEYVMAFANQAAVAIENARLFGEVRRQSEHMTTVVNFSEVLHRGLDLSQVLDHVADGVVPAAEPDRTNVRVTVPVLEQKQDAGEVGGQGQEADGAHHLRLRDAEDEHVVGRGTQDP